jgi:hypothetical protein
LNQPKVVPGATGATGATGPIQFQPPLQLNLINIVNKYKSWPNIKMISENVVLIGGSISKSDGKSQSASMSLNGSSNANSISTSYDVNVSANSVVVPETLHGPITISKQSIGSLGGITVPYSVNPSVLSATTPSSFPTGDYLISANVSLYKYGYAKVSAITAEVTSAYV